MHDVTYEQPESHFAYVVDNRDSTKGHKTESYYCMDQVEGWCSHQKASILIDIIASTAPKTIVEIGVWGGKSLLPMAYTLHRLGNGKIYGIDPWESEASLEGVKQEGNIGFWDRLDYEKVLNRLIEVIRWFELKDNVELIRDTSANAPIIDDIDILHIDGNHSDEASYLDVTKWVPLVKQGGWIIMDDMNWIEKGVVTTQRAIDYLNTHCHKIAEIDEGSLWGIWYKP